MAMNPRLLRPLATLDPDVAAFRAASGATNLTGLNRLAVYLKRPIPLGLRPLLPDEVVSERRQRLNGLRAWRPEQQRHDANQLSDLG